MRKPTLVSSDGGAGLAAALAALWPDVPIQRCTVHYADLRITPTRHHARGPQAELALAT